MGLKQIPTKIFLEYIVNVLGLVASPGKGDHTKFDYPENSPKGKLPRPMIVRTNYSEIPILHIHTNLRTLDPTNGKSRFETWLKKRQSKSKGK